MSISTVPVPSTEDLGVTDYGSSYTIESVTPICSCGRVLGVFEYDISITRASNPTMPPDEVYKAVVNKNNFNICCRNQFLNRATHTIVSADKGVLIDERSQNPVKVDLPDPNMAYGGLTLPPL